jgi:hypothetical protein
MIKIVGANEARNRTYRKLIHAIDLFERETRIREKIVAPKEPLSLYGKVGLKIANAILPDLQGWGLILLTFAELQKFKQTVA